MLSAGPSRSRQQLTIGNHLAAARRFIKPALASYHVCTAIAPRRVVPVMVEGHQCHRVGHAHGRLLLGKRFIATSPNGRFAEGAAAITGKVLSRIEVHGKNLFYFFGGSLSSSNQHNTAAMQEPQVPLLQAVDEDPLQPGALDSDSEGPGPDATTAAAEASAAAAAAAAAAPATPARRSRKVSLTAAAAAVAAAGSPHTPKKPLLAAVGSAAAAALGGSQPTSLSSDSASMLASSPTAAAAAAAAAARLSPMTPGSTAAATQQDPTSSPGPSAAAAQAGSAPEDAAADDVVVVHIHFGMSGAFRTSSLPGPEPTPTTRLRLVHEGSGLMAHLSAMTVAHGGLGLYRDKVSKLGPDPLRPDDDPERFWARVQGSKKSIGLLLMDQTAVAGVGNIYRAEILYKSGLHPEQPGNTVDRAAFEVVWGHCVDLLHRGFTSGSILTVDPEDARLLGKPWTRRYIYNQRQCGRCKGPVKIWDMATRTVYCCENCQPLRLPVAAAAAAAGAADVAGIKRGSKARSRSAPAAALDAAAAAAGLDGDPAAAAAQLLHPSRLKSMAAAKVAKEFVSHCAPDDPDDLQPTKMTCQQLRTHLKALNLDTRGNKPQLVARLEAAKGWMAAGADSAAAAAAAAGGPAAAAAAGGGGADSETEVLGSSSSSESGDELDRAEDALAERLSVPPAKRRRFNVPSTSTQQEDVDMAASTPAKAPPRSARRSRSTKSSPAAAAAAAAPTDGDGSTGRADADDGVASARAAAAEKAAAGENRAVEHVALQADEWTDQLMFGDVGTGTSLDLQQAQQQDQSQPQPSEAQAAGKTVLLTPAATKQGRTRRSRH